MSSILIKTSVILMLFMLSSFQQGMTQNTEKVFPRFKSGDGLYVLVNYVPRGCKAEVDGLYTVSKKNDISLPFTGAPIAVDRKVDDVVKDLRGAIQRYCNEKYPGGNVFPGIDIISEADVAKAGDGVMILGQTRKPGAISMRDGLTVWQALQEKGGATQYGSVMGVVIIRSKKIIYCDFPKDGSDKMPLEPGDCVFVPLKNFVPEEEFWKGQDQMNKSEMATPRKPSD